MARPELSVIVPVYNGERFLGEAIESVLRQKECTLEVIVVDDGSTDDSARVAESFGQPVTCIRQANAGPPAARNTGLIASRGDLIGFLDSDDLWPESKLATQLPILRSDSSIGITLGHISVFQDGGSPEGSRFLLQVGAGLYRKTVFDTVGFFDESFRLSDDVEWFTRAREYGVNLRVTKDVVLLYRVHDHNITWGSDSYSLGYLQILKDSLDRRRAGNPKGSKAPELPPL